MKTDVSLHFTIKGQTVQEIDQKLEKYFQENKENLIFDFSEPSTPRSVLHHCFLPEQMVKDKGFSTEVYDEILHTMSEHKVCWFGSSDYGLEWDRRLMLENIAKLGGVSVFVGEIKEGVKDEYDLAQELGVECILIP